MDQPEPPARVPVTAEWLAEQERKQVAYAASRKARAEHWEGARRVEPEPEEEGPPSPVLPRTEPPPSTKSRQRGPILDPRQGRLEF